MLCCNGMVPTLHRRGFCGRMVLLERPDSLRLTGQRIFLVMLYISSMDFEGSEY